MFRKLLSMILISIFVFNISTNVFATNLEGSMEVGVDSISESNELNYVGRIWHTEYIYFAGNAPIRLKYEFNGFIGYLTLDHQMGQDEFGGGYYKYSGYLYNPNYPYPIPTKLDKDMN